MSQYKLGQQVGGLFGPSEAEKTDAAATLKVICSSYINAVALQQGMNKAMRELSASATASKYTDSADYKAAMAALKATAEDAAIIATNSLDRIKTISEKDPGVWDYMADLGNKVMAGTIVNETITTKDGTQIQISMSSTTPQVGVLPIVLIVVAVIVLAVAGAIVSVVLTKSNRDYTASVTGITNTLRKAAEQKLLVAQKVAQAGEDLAAGKITQAQHDELVSGYNASIKTITDTENALPKAKDIPKASNPLDFTASLKYAVPIVLVVGGIIVAWKTGLFGAAKKQLEKKGMA